MKIWELIGGHKLGSRSTDWNTVPSSLPIATRVSIPSTPRELALLKELQPSPTLDKSPKRSTRLSQHLQLPSPNLVPGSQATSPGELGLPPGFYSPTSLKKIQHPHLPQSVSHLPLPSNRRKIHPLSAHPPVSLPLSGSRKRRIKNLKILN